MLTLHLLTGKDMDKNNFSLESFKNIQDLIKFIDQKTGAVLVISGLVLTTLIEFSKELVFSAHSTSIFGFLTFLFGGLSLFLLIYVIYLTMIEILRPRLAKHYTGTEFSLLYFNHLASITNKTTMFNVFNHLTDDLILKNITDQIFETSKILENKIIRLHNSMNCLFMSITTLLLFILTSRFI